MSGRKEWGFRVEDMLSSIAEIYDSVSDHSTAESLYYEDRESFRAVERNIEIIAEASKYIPADVKARHEDIQWTDIIGMRNILAHDYGRVDYTAIWFVVSNKIPALEKILNEIKDNHK